MKRDLFSFDFEPSELSSLEIQAEEEKKTSRRRRESSPRSPLALCWASHWDWDEDREAPRGSLETRQHEFPLTKKPITPRKSRRRSSIRRWRRSGGKQQLPSPSVPTCCRIKRRHKGSVVLSAGLLGERINLFHSALRLHATEREHSATSERCLSKDARSCSSRAFLSCGFRSKREGESERQRERKKNRLRGCFGETCLLSKKPAPLPVVNCDMLAY